MIRIYHTQSRPSHTRTLAGCYDDPIPETRTDNPATCAAVGWWAWLGILVTATLLPGCANHRSGGWLTFMRPKTSADWLDMALESKNADDRRQGVNGLVESVDATSPWAIKAYDTIARTDRDPMVRCTALRAMTRAKKTDRAGLAIKILTSQRMKYQNVRPAGVPVRGCAAKLLLAVVHQYAYRRDQEQEIIETLLQQLTREKDQHIRVTLIEALGYFPQGRVVKSLIEVMANENFAVQHAAELALVSLTGVTHHHDLDAWRKWFKETEDPFQHRGEYPKELHARREKPRWDWLGWWQ